MHESYQIFKIVEHKLEVYRGEFDEGTGEFESEEEAIKSLKFTPSYEGYVILKKYTKEPNLYDEIEGE